MISKLLQSLGFNFEFQKFFSIIRTIFFITVGQNNFGKIEIILELGCVCAWAAHQENVYDVHADADENPRTLKVKKKLPTVVQK